MRSSSSTTRRAARPWSGSCPAISRSSSGRAIRPRSPSRRATGSRRARLHDRKNVRLHLVGHADSQRLSPALAAKFGDNEGLSRERAGEVAEFLQTSLKLPPDAISYEWAGDTRPVASNATPEGRAQNRRVEVEVWYDVP